jgi:hypothetical protein
MPHLVCPLNPPFWGTLSGSEVPQNGGFRGRIGALFSCYSLKAILLNIPTQELAISDWTVVEFASLLSRRVRMSELSADLMQTVMQSFQEDVAQSFSMVAVTAADFRTASKLILQWKTRLRATRYI